jgi:hypothetical protein
MIFTFLKGVRSGELILSSTWSFISSFTSSVFAKVLLKSTVF